MRRLKKFNEDVEVKQTLRDLVGDIKETKSKGYRKIIETTKGCFTNLELYDEYDKIDWLDAEVSFYMYGKNSNTGEIYLKHPSSKWGKRGYVYLDNGFPKIISTYPGDERGCHLFNDVFISSGHDGNYLWNIKTGEFDSFTW